jgi:pimeloyl-ACP methyl ester carboxylesterase
MSPDSNRMAERSLILQTTHGVLNGKLHPARSPRGVIFVVDTRNAPVDARVTAHLVEEGYNVLSMDLVTTREAQFSDADENIPRLTQRLIELLDITRHDADVEGLPLGIFASGHACAAALRVAARRDNQVRAVVCLNGQIDRAGREALSWLTAPLLLLDNTDNAGIETCYQRSRPYLTTQHEFHRHSAGENPVHQAAEWFSSHLLSSPLLSSA